MGVSIHAHLFLSSIMFFSLAFFSIIFFFLSLSVQEIMAWYCQLFFFLHFKVLVCRFLFHPVYRIHSGEDLCQEGVRGSAL